MHYCGPEPVRPALTAECCPGGQEAASHALSAERCQLPFKALPLLPQTPPRINVTAMGDHAYEIGRARLTLGGGQQAGVKYVVIWKQEDGRWKLLVDIWNMSPA